MKVHPSRKDPIFFLPTFRYISIQRVAQDGALPCFALPYVGDSSKKALPVSRRILITKRRFSCSPSLYKARSFHRGGLQESCPEFEIPSGPENELIDASTGQISRVHEKLIIPSSANNSAGSSHDAAAIFSFEDFIGNFTEGLADMSSFLQRRNYRVSLLLALFIFQY